MEETSKNNETAQLGIGDVRRIYLFGEKWYQKLFFWITFGLTAIIISGVAKGRIGKSSKRAEIKNKLRYFNPTITEGFWGKKVIWVGRDKPLTEKEVDELYDTKRT